MTTITALPRVIIVSLLVGGVAYACTFLMKPTYESDEVLYFPQSSGSTNPLDLLKQGADVDKGEVNRIQDELVQTMRSSPLADVTDLMKNYFAARVDLQKAEVAQVAAEGKLRALETDSQRLVSGSDTFPNNLMTMGAFNTDVKT